MTDNCPECGSDMLGDPIPQEYIDAGHYGNKTHFSRCMGFEVREVYDGVLIWQCPDCGHYWPRFQNGYRFEAAMRLIDLWTGENYD